VKATTVIGRGARDAPLVDGHHGTDMKIDHRPWRRRRQKSRPVGHPVIMSCSWTTPNVGVGSRPGDVRACRGRGMIWKPSNLGGDDDDGGRTVVCE
jgi:hypothetical protein